ncbi:MAG: right-handed parallel beta-helix repeat-containing protein, partial [Saprospiraceae bacterium]
ATESTCQPGCILGGGEFNIVTACGPGTTLTYFTDNLGTSMLPATMYNQNSPITIYYACVSNTTGCRSAIQTLTTVPGTCPLPMVSCPANFSTTITTPAFALIGGLPAMGTYSGTGVSAGMFDPSVAGLGMHTITYSYTGPFGCMNSCMFTITVTTPGQVLNLRTGETFVTIQEAIDDAQTLSFDTIKIPSGIYPGFNAASGGKSLTFAPGNSPGCVNIVGDMILNGGDVLLMELNGTTACTLYDQFIVNGMVTLGGATLSLSIGYAPANGDQFKIIDNDLADAVSGQFVQGATINAGGYTFYIDYADGGNDVVLTKCAGGVTNTNTSETFCTLQQAINDPQTLDGHTITIAAGTYVEIGQIVISKNLTIIGADKTTTFIKPDASTAFGDAWILVNPGKTLHLSKVTLDGTGKLIYTGIKQEGNGTVNDCNITGIKYNESTAYKGTAIHIESTGNVNVTNCTFTQIGRNGILADNCTGTYSGNTYTGKGAGDWLDYFILSEYGDNVIISNNTISNCTGIASADGSGSSGIAVWDDPNTEAQILGNTLTNNSIGVAIVGINGATTDPQVLIGAGNLFDGGEYGVAFQAYAGPYSPDVTFTGISTYKGQTVAAISIDDGISAGVTFDISSA